MGRDEGGLEMEKLFESSLWASRFMVILAVVFGLIGAIALFVVASFDIYETAKMVTILSRKL